MTKGTNGRANGREPVLVVLQLSGGNDFMNTVVPYGEPLYYDYRQTVGIPESELLHIDPKLGFHPALAEIKDMWDAGNVAVINGTGYPEPDRSHFRSMDIWHTANPFEYVSEGWLGRTIRELDPEKRNVVTGVSFGPGLPRAMYLSGTPAVSVTQLEGYGLLTNLEGQDQRAALNVFTRMYAPIEFDEQQMIMDHIGQTGRETRWRRSICSRPRRQNIRRPSNMKPIRWPRTCGTSSRCTPPDWGHASSTHNTADTTFTGTRCRPSRSCGGRSRGR